MHLSPFQRLVASVLVLVPIGITAAYFMAYADNTLPHDSVTIALCMAYIPGILVATAGVLVVYRMAGQYLRWLFVWTVGVGLSAVLVAILAWLVSQRWETLTAGTSDQYIVSIMVWSYLASYTLTLLIQAAFVVKFDDPSRIIVPWQQGNPRLANPADLGDEHQPPELHLLISERTSEEADA